MITRLSNAYDFELFEEQIKKLPVCVQEVILEKVQTLNNSYGKYWESAFGSAEMYIVGSETEGKAVVKEILEFYNIDPSVDAPEYSDVIVENHLNTEPVYTDTLWLLTNGEKPIVIISCE